MTARQLAALLSAELEADGWGDVDPWWIKGVAESDVSDPDDDHSEQIEALRKVFERAAAKLDQPRLTVQRLSAEVEIEQIRLIRLALHADDAERATRMIDQLANELGIQ